MAKKKSNSKPIEVATPAANSQSQIKLLKYIPYLLIPLFVIYYYKLLFGMNYLWEDILYQGYPNVNFTVSSLKQGLFPFWTPYVFGGMPFAADPQTILLYPPSWPFFIVSMFSEPGGLTFTWYILIHVLLLGLGTFILTIHLGFHRIAALFSAIAFMFCGYVSLHILHTFVYVMAWFPFVFLFLNKALNSGKLIHVLLAGLMYGISTLGGYPQYSMWCAYFLFLWTFYKAFNNRNEGWSVFVKYLFCFSITAGLGLAMAAVQYLPAFELMAESARESMTFEESVKGSTPFSYFLTLFSPKFFGFVYGDRSLSSPFWAFEGQSHFFWETCLFIGVTTIFLALRSILDFKKNPTVMFLSILSLILLILAMGNYTPLYKIVFTIVPGFSNFRIPGRFSLFFSFSMILLAGMGLTSLLKEDKKKEKQYLIASSTIAGVLIFFSFLFIAGAFDTSSKYFTHVKILKNSKGAMGTTIGITITIMVLIIIMLKTKFRQLIGILLSLFLFIELFSFGSNFGAGKINPKSFYRRFNLGPFKNELKKEKYRIQSRLYRGPGEGQRLLPRNLGNVENLPLTEGYNQLRLTRYNDLIYKVDIDVGQKLFNIRYRKLPDMNQFSRLQTTPRFYLSSSYKVFNTRDEVINYMNSDDFVTGKDIAMESEPNITINQGGNNSGTVKVIKENINEIELEVNAKENAILSASEVYFSAWKAYIDGKKAQLIPANLLFRGIPVPKGKHKVVMKYQSSAFSKGLAISVTSLIIILLGIFGKSFLPEIISTPWFGFKTSDGKIKKAT